MARPLGELKPAVVYAIVCPDSGDWRYIGQTTNWTKRRRSYMRGVGGSAQLNVWLRGLFAAGKQPAFSILTSVFIHDDVVDRGRIMRAIESQYIRTAIRHGCDLLNGCREARQSRIV